MGSKSRNKGFGFERELVNQAKAAGLKSERAYGSNGRALGEVEEVDLLINHYRVQAKRRKKMADYLTIPEGCDIVIIREDHNTAKVIINYEDFLKLIE